MRCFDFTSHKTMLTCGCIKKHIDTRLIFYAIKLHYNNGKSSFILKFKYFLTHCAFRFISLKLMS